MLCLPQERVLIDAVSLQEEIVLERELIEEEMRFIDAAWAAYEPRATWSQPLPMQLFCPEPYWNLSGLQVQFLQHLIFQGEIGLAEAVSLVHRLAFRSAYETLQERYGRLGTSYVVEAANLMSELRAVV